MTTRTRGPSGNVMDVQPQRIGLIAGWGRFPIIVAQELVRSGNEVYCCGIRGHASPELQEICTRFRWFGMAKMGGQLRFFKRHRVQQATMAGKIFKTNLFKRFQLLHHLPDLKSLQHFYPILFSGKKDRNDDTLLLTVTELFESGNVALAPATDFAPELLVKEGMLTHGKLSTNQQADIEFGWKLAKEMGRLDIGQSVAVKGRAVLAVEAVEGTDECIRRAGKLSQSGNFVVVKVAKPQQDMRFDVPTIGVSTIETMHQAGARVLAIEADKTILLDRDAVVELANRFRISIVVLPNTRFSELAA